MKLKKGVKEKKFDFLNEIKRKAVHIFALLYVLIYVFVAGKYGHGFGLFALTGLLVVFLIVDFFRVERKKKILFFYQFWRPKEKGRFGGQVFFLSGVIIVFAVFSFKIALAAILMTIFGDMAAALVGKKYGKHYLASFKDRAWEGILGEFFVDVIVGVLVFFWGVWNFGSWELWLIVLVMAVVATLVETVLDKLDDNLMIPVFSGFFGYVVWLLVF